MAIKIAKPEAPPPEGIIPPSYVRHERRVMPYRYNPDEEQMGARDEAAYYMDRYKKAKDTYDQSAWTDEHTQPSNYNRYNRYAEMFQSNI